MTPPKSLASYGTLQADLLRGFADAAKAHLAAKPVAVVLATPVQSKALPRGVIWQGIFDDVAGLHRVPICFAKVEAALASQLARLIADPAGWGGACKPPRPPRTLKTGCRLPPARFGVAMVSLCNRSLLIDAHLLAALRGYPARSPCGVGDRRGDVQPALAAR